MKIACAYSQKYGNDNKRWIDERVADGFTYMEMAVSMLPDDEAVQDEVISYAKARGLDLNFHAPYGINNISSSDKARLASSVANVKHAIDLAAKHKLGVVTFHPGRLSDDVETAEENWPRMMAVVAEIAQYAKEMYLLKNVNLPEILVEVI